MGVKHMASYLRSRCYKRIPLTYPPSGCSDRNLLVYDVLGCSDRYLWRSSLIWDFHGMLQKVQADVDAFSAAGFELVVVLDAGVDEEKMGTWLRRRKVDQKAVEKLNKCGVMEDIPRSLQVWHSPLSCVEYLGQAFRRAGCRVVFTLGEADHEAAWLAISERAYGVVSCDTDFLMYPGVKRYFDSQTLDVCEDGTIMVDVVEKEGLIASVGMSELQLPAVAGLCGNDVLTGQPKWCAQKAKGEYGVDYKFEAAVMRLGKTRQSEWSEQCKKAIAHYKPVEPAPQCSQHLLTFILRSKQVMMRGVTVEDLKEPPVFKVLLPLRRAVYARMGIMSVREKMCSPHYHHSDWCKWSTIEMEDDEARAQPVPADPESLVLMAHKFLEAAGVMEDYHLSAIVCQITDRERLITQMLGSQSKVTPKLRDVHAAVLFLEAADCLSIGAEEAVQHSARISSEYQARLSGNV